MEIYLPEDPAILLLGIYAKDDPPCHRDLFSIMFIAALFVIARSWKLPRCPTTEVGYRKCLLFIYRMEYYTVINNEDIPRLAGKWMELENIILSVVTLTKSECVVCIH